MREAREGEINIQEMNPATLRSMIHYIYTGRMAEDWRDLDIPDVVRAADMYELPQWLYNFLCAMWTGGLGGPAVYNGGVTGEQLAEVIIAGSRHGYFGEMMGFVKATIRSLVYSQCLARTCSARAVPNFRRHLHLTMTAAL